jgi:hypothetical protein
MSYGFPIINVCNPGVHYERACIVLHNYALPDDVPVSAEKRSSLCVLQRYCDYSELGAFCRFTL